MRLKSFSIKNYKSIGNSGSCHIDTNITILAGKNEAGKTAILEALRDFDASVREFPGPAKPVDGPTTTSLRLDFDLDANTLKEIIKCSKIRSLSTSAYKYILEYGLALLKDEEGGICRYSIDHELRSKIRESGQLSTRDEQRLVNQIEKSIPRFVLFGDFSTNPSLVTAVSSADEDATTSSFADLAGLDLQQFKNVNADLRRRTSLLGKAEDRINGEFTRYWEQVKISAGVDGERLRFLVKDLLKNELFEPSQRSKGFQWFLSFYLELCKKEDRILLIDEPALYLHPKAQESVLEVFEKTAERPRTQIIFSTHSPFLINPEKLGRVKLVVKDQDGTRIVDKFHDTKDPETLTPIIKAIGIGPDAGFSLAKRYNVIVEGISDYYYIQALRSLLPRRFGEFSVIPCTGADRINQIVPIIYGWGLQFVLILDNDKKGVTKKNEILELLPLQDEQVMLIPAATPDSAIEDMFSWDDFNKFVLATLGYRNDDPTIKNSKFSKRLNKVLLAKLLHEKVNTEPSKLKFSQQTINGFSDLFSGISAYFGSDNRIGGGQTGASTAYTASTPANAMQETGIRQDP